MVRLLCTELGEKKGILSAKSHLYRSVHGFWPVEELADLADGPTGSVELARGGLELHCDKVTCTDGGQKFLDQTWRCRYISDSLPAYGLKIPPARNRALHYC